MYNNTGKLVYQWLRQYDQTTGLPTGLRKPNDPADKDYVPPVDNITACPLPYTWEPVDPFCIRTLEPIPNNTGDKGWQNRRRLVNNIPDGFVEPNTEGTGIGPYFPPVRDTNACPVTVAELNPFDYCVVRYIWTADAGADLDTFTRLVNTGTQYDNQWVGYHQGGSDPKVPAGAAANDAYLWWASDNTNSGVEAVLLNYKSFIRDFASTPDAIEVRMNAVWYGVKQNGRINIQLTTYLGGTMAAGSNYDFINTGGTVVDNVTLAATVNTNSQAANIANSDNVAVVRYNKSTKQATIQIV